MQKPDKYAAIKEEIHAIYHENLGRYGYRRITMELHNRGYQVNHKTVLKLMKDLPGFLMIQALFSIQTKAGSISTKPTRGV